MATPTNLNGELPSAEIWQSHNKMVLEPLDTNDPEVSRLASAGQGGGGVLWRWVIICFIHPASTGTRSTVGSPAFRTVRLRAGRWAVWELQVPPCFSFSGCCCFVCHLPEGVEEDGGWWLSPCLPRGCCEPAQLAVPMW